MKQIQIASILNTQVIPNSLGQTLTIAEDLSNIVEVGTALASMTSDQVKNFQKTTISGVALETINRMIEEQQFAILRTSEEYAAGKQRVVNKALRTAMDSHLLNLVENVDYHDGHFYGGETDVKIYEQTKSFKVPHSVSEDNYAMFFKDPASVSRYWALIEANVENTIRQELNQLQKRVLAKLAFETIKDGRAIHLITDFNREVLGQVSTDAGYKDYDAIKADRELRAYFSDYIKECTYVVPDAMTDINDKYNDGTVETFAPASDINILLLSKIAADIKFMADPVDRNIPGGINDFRTISCWQNPGKTLLPDLATAATIKVIDGEETTTYTNVIGLIYDKYAAGVELQRSKTTVEDVGAEGFRTLFNHINANYYIDSRMGAVALVLD